MFLRTAKKVALSKSLYRLRVVSGNQSADLDSVVSAISYAFLDPESEPIVPLINIPKADLLLRKDIEYVLHECGIPNENLLFSDDLEHVEAEFVELILVDHNVPQGEALQTFLNRHKVTVTCIIDHHVDEGMFKDASPRIISSCGSCSSLITNFFISLGIFQPCTAKLLIAPLLADTAFMKQRVEQPDTQAFEVLSKCIKGLNLDTYFYEISKMKSDISGLSLEDVLRKDYKLFKLQADRVGISSIVKPFEWLLNEYGGVDNLVKTCKSYGSEQHLDYLVLMTAFSKDDEFKREIAFIGVKKDPKKMSSALADELALEEIPTDHDRAVFCVQHNSKASRKQVAPLIRDKLAL